MYKITEIKSGLQEARKSIDDWEEELQQIEEGIHKFYKRKNQRAGRRARRILKLMRDNIDELRRDILRLYKERKIIGRKEIKTPSE